jgi:transposase, IS6 family
LAVRWYLQFPISYRDLECMFSDRGVQVDHTTFFRWIQAYAPELDKRIRPHLRITNGSRQVDETYIRVKGEWVYLYRAVDVTGQGSVALTSQSTIRSVQASLSHHDILWLDMLMQQGR